MLDCSQAPVQLCYYTTQVHLPRNDTSHSELGSPSSVTNTESAPTNIHLQATLMDTVPQLRFPLLVCFKLTKIDQHTVAFPVLEFIIPLSYMSVYLSSSEIQVTLLDDLLWIR